MFPKNVVSHAANGEIVPFIVFTIMAGVALVYLQEREKEAAVPFKNFIDSANKLMFGTNIAALGSKPFMVAPTKEHEVELGQGGLFDINDLEEVA